MRRMPPIILLHGWSLSGKVFAPLVSALKDKGYSVYAPDFPGFGDSKTPERPFTLVDYVQFLHEYLKKKRVEQPIFLGHSFGGRVSLKYQLLYPNNVRALILTGTPGFTPIPRKKLLFFIMVAKIGGFLFSIPPLNIVQHQVRRWYYYVVGARDFFRAEGAMRETFKHVVKEDLVDAMEAVRVPCLLLWGDLDIIVPSGIAERMHRVIEGSELIVVPNADHGVPFKHAEVTARYVDQFIKNL